PAAHARRGAGAQQVDGAAAAELMAGAIGRQMALMAAPAELGWLRPLADEALDRPGVDELVPPFRPRRDLRVALGDMDDADAEPMRELAPFAARLGLGHRGAGVARDGEQRFLDQM